LIPKYHKLLSNFACFGSNSKLRHYGAGDNPGNTLHPASLFSAFVGRCRLPPGKPQVDPACSQRLKLNHDKLVSNVALNCNLRHYAYVHIRAHSSFFVNNRGVGIILAKVGGAWGAAACAA